MKTLVVVVLMLLAFVFIYIRRHKISSYFNKEINYITDLNYSNEAIESLILRFEKLTSSELIDLIENKKITDNEFRALRKILNDRNVIIPDNNNFS